MHPHYISITELIFRSFPVDNKSYSASSLVLYLHEKTENWTHSVYLSLKTLQQKLTRCLNQLRSLIQVNTIKPMPLSGIDIT